MSNNSELALLVLEDGTAFLGGAFGAFGVTYGEIVFATAMTGYQETLTDPSYCGQIVIQTAPHIGNTGMNALDNESAKIWVNGYVVKEPSRIISSWRGETSLNDELEKDGVAGIFGIDTRALTRKLRESGVMKAGIFSGAEFISDNLAQNMTLENLALGDKVEAPAELIAKVKASEDMSGAHLAEKVTTKRDIVSLPIPKGAENLEFGINASADEIVQNGQGLKIVALDMGIKAMTPKLFTVRGVEVHTLPLTTSFAEIEALSPDGVFFSNGPGDPSSAVHEVQLLREVLANGYPFFGICMGNQILGRALGFDTYKLKFGHRGINQPVKDLQTGRVEITAHNHGFAIDIPVGEPDEFGVCSHPPEVIAPYNEGQFGRVKVSHIGLNDNVVEGIECLDIPAFSVQYHPEAAAGPHDASYLFDRFIEIMLNNKK